MCVCVCVCVHSLFTLFHREMPDVCVCVCTLTVHPISQGDARSYNYVVVLSCPDTSEPDWPDLMRLAKIIPRVCHNVNR